MKKKFRLNPERFFNEAKVNRMLLKDVDRKYIKGWRVLKTVHYSNGITFFDYYTTWSTSEGKSYFYEAWKDGIYIEGRCYKVEVF